MSFGAIGAVRLFDLGSAIATCGLVVTFVTSAIRNSRALYVAEPREGR